MSTFLIHAHRGDRQFHPENTIEAFLSAVRCGSYAIEMDVVISACGKIVVSHDPFFSSTICTGFEHLPNNLYKLNYEQIETVNCGFPAHPDFPKQKVSNTSKPLLSHVIEAVTKYCDDKQYDLPNFNIEIKSAKTYEPIYQPSPDVFAEIVAQTVLSYLKPNTFSLHSFDVRVLQYLKTHYPQVRLGYLTESAENAEEQLDRLTFKPQIYGIDYTLLTSADTDFLRGESIINLPFTVNNVNDMIKLHDMGINGIVTDVPRVATKLFGKLR